MQKSAQIHMITRRVISSKKCFFILKKNCPDAVTRRVILQEGNILCGHSVSVHVYQ